MFVEKMMELISVLSARVASGLRVENSGGSSGVVARTARVADTAAEIVVGSGDDAMLITSAKSGFAFVKIAVRGDDIIVGE